ncbi:MAG TPA: hypothetical protein VIH09_08930 [Flavobacterium sp.]|uniref:hypothetical protein n=1 Tax=Flavobacterium sp. TaxID=239 RepID=UPI002F413B28
MRHTEWFFRHFIAIAGTIFSVVAAVVILQEDAMISLGFCAKGDALCIISANLGVISIFALSIAFVALLTVIMSDGIPLIIRYIYQGIRRYIKTPNFRNVKISFVETKTGEISIQVRNKEWHTPSVKVEALCNGNLRWIPYQESDIATLKKGSKKYAAFLKTTANEFRIESLNDEVVVFPIGNHKLSVVLYISVEKIRISRTFIVEVDYKGGNKINVVKIMQHEDMPQSDEAWEIYERKIKRADIL